MPAHQRGARLRTLVVDDEQLARSGLRAMLATDPELDVEECASGREAIRIIRDATARPVDLVFLDVRMPAMDGFDVIAAVGVQQMPVVVFTTAHSDFALQAFEACALDYLLKPVRESRLSQAIQRGKAAVQQRRVGELSQQLAALLAHRPGTSPVVPVVEQPRDAHPSTPLRRILLQSGATSYYVDTGDIDWIEADTYYARIWTGLRSHLLRRSLTQLETELDPTQFLRVHRSAIVNVHKVRELKRVGLGKYCVRLHDGRQIPMSRDRRAELHKALRAR